MAVIHIQGRHLKVGLDGEYFNEELRDFQNALVSGWVFEDGVAVKPGVVRVWNWTHGEVAAHEHQALIWEVVGKSVAWTLGKLPKMIRRPGRWLARSLGIPLHEPGKNRFLVIDNVIRTTTKEITHEA